MLTKQQIDEIMEQAQVFASAWSLVGGVFDSGNALEVAEKEKADLEAMLAAHNAGAQEPVAIPDGWMLVKRERIEEIRQHARTEFVNSYLGRNLYDERSLMQNERIGEEALDNIRGVLSWIEEDEKDRIAAQPQPMTAAARDALAEIITARKAMLKRIDDVHTADRQTGCNTFYDNDLERHTAILFRAIDAEIERLDRAKGK